MAEPAPAPMRPFFIVGTPRSGSTLLHAMLSRHPQVAMPPETHFMALTWQRRRALGDIATDAGWSAARAAVLMSIRQREFAITEAELDEAITDIPRTYASLLEAWLALVASKEQRPIVGEKSPQHAGTVVELLAMLPAARVIHIVRDPRDVVVGNAEVWESPPLLTALRWRRDQRRWREHSRLLAPDRYRWVRYEDLVTDPGRALAPLCDLLGIEFTEAMLDPGGRRQAGFGAGEAHKQQTLRPISRSRIGRYRERLTRGQIAATESVCGPLMPALGYEPDVASAARRHVALAVRIGPTALQRVMIRRKQRQRLARRINAAQQKERPDRTPS